MAKPCTDLELHIDKLRCSTQSAGLAASLRDGAAQLAAQAGSDVARAMTCVLHSEALLSEGNFAGALPQLHEARTADASHEVVQPFLLCGACICLIFHARDYRTRWCTWPV